MCIVLGLVIIYGSLYYWPHSSTVLDEGVSVIIKNGDSFSRVTRNLSDNEIIKNRLFFYLYGRIQGFDHQIKAGQYFFQGSLSYHEIYQKIVKGLIVTQPVTFYEGMRATQMAKRLAQTLEADSTQFMYWVKNAAYCKSLGVNATTLEGYLFPDTYFFPVEVDAKYAIEQMVNRFFEVVHDSIIQQAETKGMTLHDLVILASIVEGEAAIAEERPKIAALYLNRLKKRIPLQADPTIQYIIAGGPRRLLNKDLEIDSPYNTYLYRGLPFGPVNNPGLASMLAVLNPDSVNYLYMVANGDGSHTFSSNLEDHIRAKKKFDRIRRQIERQRNLQR